MKEIVLFDVTEKEITMIHRELGNYGHYGKFSIYIHHSAYGNIHHIKVHDHSMLKDRLVKELLLEYLV